MAFRHFHKHKKKYMIVASIATIFVMFTFSVTTAISAFTGSGGSPLGGTSWLRFQTTSGRTVEYNLSEWTRLKNEIIGLCNLVGPMAVAPVLPDSVGDAPLIHAICLAEAEEMGLHIPESVIDRSLANLYASFGRDGQSMSKRDFNRILSQVGLNQASFKERMREVMKASYYREAVEGSRVYDPQDIKRHFERENELISLEYVEFPFEDYAQTLRDDPASEEELKEYFLGLPANIVQGKFSRPERFDLELALLDYSDESFTLPEAALEDFEEPSDAELLAKYRREPNRYEASAGPVEEATDIPENSRAKILRDLQMKAALSKLREVFDAAVNPEENTGDSLDDIDELLGEEGEGGPRQVASEDGEGLSAEEKAAQDSAEFQRLVAEWGLRYERHNDLERQDLMTLDPPNDTTLPFVLGGLQPGEVRVVEAAGERQWGYLLRLVERKARAPKTFDEAKDDVLEHWVTEQAEVTAKEAADSFRNGIRDQAVAQLDAGQADFLAAARDEMNAEIDGSGLSQNEKEQRKDAVERDYFLNVSSLVRGKEDELFVKQATADGLERKTIENFRRDIGRTPTFYDRYEGAERFLMRLDTFGDTPQLLGFAAGEVSDVLLDSAGKTCYVARILSRTRPSMDDINQVDRSNAEANAQREVQTRLQIPYQNRFSMQNLAKMHKPELRILSEEEQAAAERQMQ